MTQITVDKQTCNGCEACTQVCIAHVYGMAEKRAVAAHPEFCWKCGHCVAVCPVGAISHENYPLAECPILESDHLPSFEDLMTTFRERRSTRSFKETSIPRETVRELLELGRFAPTGSNSQNVDWLAIDSKLKIQELSMRTVQFLTATGRLQANPLVQICLRLSKGRQFAKMAALYARKVTTLMMREEMGDDPIFFRAPVVVFAITTKSDSSGRDNAVHALYNIELAARRMGLAACQMGFARYALERSRSLREFVGVPADKDPQAVLAIGAPKVTYHRVLPRRRPQVTWLN